MVLRWDSLGQAANIAELSGLDAFGLISMITEAVHTVRHNKEACKQLAQRVQMIADLLQSMQSSEMMQRPETRKPLNGLEEVLRRAYILVTSCQNSNYVYLFFMGDKLASQFSEVQNIIDFYLQLFPVIRHIDTTRRLVRILNGVHPPQQEEQMGKIVEMNERTTASCESIARRDDKSGCSIQDVMALVEECGAAPRSNEHFIATVLFTKRAEREMFMTLRTPEDRIDWLRRKHEWLTRNDVPK